MLIVGLTGSLGMGKSTAAAHLRARGLPVFDADADVHRLYAGPAAPAIEAAFPGTTRDGHVDRTRLSAALVAEPGRFRQLEAIVHPMVRESERAFLKEQAARGADIAVLEIPLLFETRADALVDATIVVSTTPEQQRRRLMQRPGLTPEMIDSLLARQVPDAEKRRRADFVVDTSVDVAESRTALDTVIDELKRRTGTAYARHWA